MDLTLKDESVVDIGRAVGDNVNSMIPQSQALVPAGGATAPAVVEPMPMNPFDSMMVVLSDIRDGIYSLVDKFSEGVSLQKDQIQDQEMAQDLAQVGGGDDVAPPMDDADTGDNRGFFAKAKDKVSGLLGAGGFKGLLIKGGLIFGLLGIAKMLQKYGGEIAKAITPVVEGLKTFYNYVKDDIGKFATDIMDFVKGAVSGIVNIFKGIFGDGENKGDLLRDGIAELLTLPAKFLAAVGKLALGVLDAFLGVFGMNDPTPEWLTKMYEFLDELPAKVKQFFVDVMEFFTVTIPEKIQLAKDTVSQWFTDSVDGIKQFFTDVKTFFTETVPTKISEVYTNITNWFGDIVGGIKGFFTDAFDFVTETIPEKMGEITKGIADKFVEIKDQIIDFAMTPFRKIRELFDNLLIGILESIEGIPLIGGKAKEMKENILAKREEANKQIEAEAEENTEANAFANLQKDLVKHEDKINDFIAASGLPFDLEGSLYHYSRGVKKLRFASGDTSSNILTSNFEDDEKMKMLMSNTNAAIQGAGETTGGATGGELNNAGAEFVSTGGGKQEGGFNIYQEGAKVNTVSSNQNYMNEDTGSSDKGMFKYINN